MGTAVKKIVGWYLCEVKFQHIHTNNFNSVIEKSPDMYLYIHFIHWKISLELKYKSWIFLRIFYTLWTVFLCWSLSTYLFLFKQKSASYCGSSNNNIQIWSPYFLYSGMVWIRDNMIQNLRGVHKTTRAFRNPIATFTCVTTLFFKAKKFSSF